VTAGGRRHQTTSTARSTTNSTGPGLDIVPMVLRETRTGTCSSARFDRFIPFGWFFDYGAGRQDPVDANRAPLVSAFLIE
jgi:hypothetical protein